jgi:hypothetical protein
MVDLSGTYARWVATQLLCSRSSCMCLCFWMQAPLWCGVLSTAELCEILTSVLTASPKLLHRVPVPCSWHEPLLQNWPGNLVTRNTNQTEELDTELLRAKMQCRSPTVMQTVSCRCCTGHKMHGCHMKVAAYQVKTALSAAQAWAASVTSNISSA